MDLQDNDDVTAVVISAIERGASEALNNAGFRLETLADNSALPDASASAIRLAAQVIFNMRHEDIFDECDDLTTSEYTEQLEEAIDKADI
ncbi:MAG: hypothetical protein AAFR65_10475 [Pseudomonadota bacterium]